MGKYSFFVIFRALDEMGKGSAVVSAVALIVIGLALWLGLTYG